MKLLKSGESYFCVVSREYSYSNLRKKFLIKCKVRDDSFAYSYMDKIFSGLFLNAINLKEEYVNYYKEEYEDFALFLYQKELLEIDEITSFHLDDQHVLLKLQTDLNGYNLRNLIQYDDDIIECINKMLEEAEA